MAGADAFEFISVAGDKIAVRFRPSAPGQAIGQIKMQASDGSTFAVSREAGSDFFNTLAHYGRDGRDLNQVVRVGAQDTAELVSEELSNSGAHGVYLKTLDLIEPLIG